MKRRRHQRLLQKPEFIATEALLEDERILEAVASEFQPEAIIHLAAEAGVRYSLEEPLTHNG